MEKSRFLKLKAWVERKVVERRAEGDDNDLLRCWIIGVVDSSSDGIKEDSFTASQLKELFDLTF